MRRAVARTTNDFSDPLPTSCCHRHYGADRVPIAHSAPQLKSNPRVAVAPVIAKQNRRTSIRHPEHVDRSIIVEIACRQGAANVSFRKRWPVYRAHLLELGAAVLK